MKGSENKAVFSKLQLVKSLRFRKHADLLNTALENDKDYSLKNHFLSYFFFERKIFS